MALCQMDRFHQEALVFFSESVKQCKCKRGIVKNMEVEARFETPCDLTCTSRQAWITVSHVV